MRTLLASLGMLLGVLLCVAGIVAILLTGVDPLGLGLGAACVGLGSALTWFCRRQDQPTKGADGNQRAQQRPLDAAEKKSQRQGPPGGRL